MPTPSPPGVGTSDANAKENSGGIGGNPTLQRLPRPPGACLCSQRFGICDKKTVSWVRRLSLLHTIVTFLFPNRGNEPRKLTTFNVQPMFALVAVAVLSKRLQHEYFLGGRPCLRFFVWCDGYGCCSFRFDPRDWWRAVCPVCFSRACLLTPTSGAEFFAQTQSTSTSYLVKKWYSSTGIINCHLPLLSALLPGNDHPRCSSPCVRTLFRFYNSPAVPFRKTFRACGRYSIGGSSVLHFLCQKDQSILKSNLKTWVQRARREQQKKTMWYERYNYIVVAHWTHLSGWRLFQRQAVIRLTRFTW